ncbi:MAG: peptidoglycan-binding domain-containing protein [Patescibacteria group bacterium]
MHGATRLYNTMKKYLLTGVLALSLLMPAGVAFAESTSSPKGIDDLIASLQRQVAELLGKIDRLKAEKSNAPVCPSFNRDLTPGSKGDDVIVLRKALKSLGLDVAADGSYDEDLAAFVVKFQGKHGIRQTGIVGPLTRGKLNSLCAKAATAISKEIKEVKKEEKKEEKIAEKKVEAVPVLSKLDGGVNTIVAGSFGIAIGSSLKGVNAAWLISTTDSKQYNLDYIVKGDEALKLIASETIPVGQYKLHVANSLGTSNALVVEVKLKTN